jgi:DNA-binding MarR family transcriptional regulator
LWHDPESLSPNADLLDFMPSSSAARSERRPTWQNRQPSLSANLARKTCKFGCLLLFVAAMSRRVLKSGVAEFVNAVRDANTADFVHAVGLLIRRVRAAAAAHELSWSETAVIGRLAKSGPATTAGLARAEAVRPQSMGATIAALEERGLVERKPHPTDGRQVNIVLTAKGAAVRKSVKDAKLTWLAQAIAGLDDKDRETLFAAGEIIKRLVEK